MMVEVKDWSLIMSDTNSTLTALDNKILLPWQHQLIDYIFSDKFIIKLVLF